MTESTGLRFYLPAVDGAGEIQFIELARDVDWEIGVLIVQASTQEPSWTLNSTHVSR